MTQKPQNVSLDSKVCPGWARSKELHKNRQKYVENRFFKIKLFGKSSETMEFYTKTWISIPEHGEPRLTWKQYVQFDKSYRYVKRLHPTHVRSRFCCLIVMLINSDILDLYKLARKHSI